MIGCAWVWYSYVIGLHAYDFVMKDFVIKKGCYLCWTLYVFQFVWYNWHVILWKFKVWNVFIFILQCVDLYGKEWLPPQRCLAPPPCHVIPISSLCWEHLRSSLLATFKYWMFYQFPLRWTLSNINKLLLLSFDSVRMIYSAYPFTFILPAVLYLNCVSYKPLGQTTNPFFVF